MGVMGFSTAPFLEYSITPLLLPLFGILGGYLLVMLTNPVRVALRDGFGLPGMRVLQFAFDGDAANPHRPYLHERASIVYTGTHDNDTTPGWYSHLDAASAARVDLYLGSAAGAIAQALIRAALGSVARLAVVPVQDLLGLGSEARLNTPGTVSGNWSWRLPPAALTADLARRCAELNAVYGRS